MVTRADVLQSTVPLVLGGNRDLTVDINNNRTYFICTAALTLTLPAASSYYRGRVIHVSSHVGTVNTAGGTVTGLNGSTITTLLSGAGNWATLVCDESSWVVVMAD